jgi:hypothetical protein
VVGSYFPNFWYLPYQIVYQIVDGGDSCRGCSSSVGLILRYWWVMIGDDVGRELVSWGYRIDWGRYRRRHWSCRFGWWLFFLFRGDLIYSLINIDLDLTKLIIFFDRWGKEEIQVGHYQIFIGCVVMSVESWMDGWRKFTYFWVGFIGIIEWELLGCYSNIFYQNNNLQLTEFPVTIYLINSINHND